MLLIITRLLFGGLLAFEFLNYINVLDFSLNFTWLGLMLTAGGLWAISEVVLSRVKDSMSNNARGFAMIGLAAMVYTDAIGDINEWYGKFPNFDALMHFIGGAAGAMVLFMVYRAYRKGRPKKFGVSEGWSAFVAFLTVNFFGIIYELEEYLEDVFTDSNRLGDGPDTANDLMLNMFGAMVVILILWRYFVWHDAKKKK